LWNEPDETPETQDNVVQGDLEPNPEASPDSRGSELHHWEDADHREGGSEKTGRSDEEVSHAHRVRDLSYPRGRRHTLSDANAPVQSVSHFTESANPDLVQQAPAFPIHRLDEVNYEKALAAGAPVALAVLFEGINRMGAYQYHFESVSAIESAVVADVNRMKMAERIMHYQAVNKQGKEPMMNWQEDIPDYNKYSPAVRAAFEKKMAEAEAELDRLADAEVLEHYDDESPTEPN